MTREELVMLDLSVKDKLHLFEKISEKALELGIIEDKQKLVESFYERERNFETYLGTGCAIPHVRSENIKDSCIFFVRLAKAIKWADDDMAEEIFAILSKDTDSDLHIEMLMNVSKKVMNDKLLKKLQKTKDVKEVVEIINL